MTIHIALLRAVNVGGRKPINMAELRDLVTELGLVGVRVIDNRLRRAVRKREPLRSSGSPE